MSQIKAKVIADSLTPEGYRITSFELVYPRWILAEVNTHRAFSRSSVSSRAIPIRKLIAQVFSDPALPVHWGANQPGMQANKELEGWRLMAAKSSWWLEGMVACGFAAFNNWVGLHKQVANRGLEKRQLVRTIVTATDLKNFFELRYHKDAQPEFQVLAAVMWEAYQLSIPQRLKEGQWHLPYVTPADIRKFKGTVDDWKLPVISAARCARVSYNLHNGQTPSVEKDLKLFRHLVLSKPSHASPCEHQAQVNSKHYRSRNFQGGWWQFREILELYGWGEYAAVGDSSEPK